MSDVKQQWEALGALLTDIASEVTESGGGDTSAVVAGLGALNESLLVAKAQLVASQGSGTVQVLTA